VLVVEVLSLSEDVIPSRDERSLVLSVSRFRFVSCSTRLSVLAEPSEVSLDDELSWMLETMRERNSGSAFSIDAFAAERRMLYMESSEELSLESPKRLTMSSVMLLTELSVVLLVEELEDVEVVDDDDARLLSRELRELRELETLLTLDMSSPPSIPLGVRSAAFVGGGKCTRPCRISRRIIRKGY
jgi:hypothetical protein